MGVGVSEGVEVTTLNGIRVMLPCTRGVTADRIQAHNETVAGAGRLGKLFLIMAAVGSVGSAPPSRTPQRASCVLYRAARCPGRCAGDPPGCRPRFLVVEGLSLLSAKPLAANLAPFNFRSVACSAEGPPPLPHRRMANRPALATILVRHAAHGVLQITPRARAVALRSTRRAASTLPRVHYTTGGDG